MHHYDTVGYKITDLVEDGKDGFSFAEHRIYLSSNQKERLYWNSANLLIFLQYK